MSASNHTSVATTPPKVAYAAFAVTVARIERLGSSFLRVTFRGDDLAHFHFVGLDQRVKLVLPNDESGLSTFPRGIEDWYSAWRETPEPQRCVLRTYTVRDARPALREIDIDFVVHGETGPATRWVSNAVIGDELLVIGPDARTVDLDDPRRVGGAEFNPGNAGRILLAGDETAVPAICSILEAMPRKARGQVFIEIPTKADILPVVAPGGVTVCWLARDERPGLAHGEVLDRAVRAWVSEMVPAPTAEGHRDSDRLADVDIDHDILWEVPGEAAPGEEPQGVAEPATSKLSLYAWLAGEAGCIKDLRRFLVRDSGVHRTDVAFMGYWRLGRSEN
ncbi:MAG: siderophore-interacting protein [Glaciihabitans sp.]|nr:siderophore-interacting protein [Glaciihabitans sp.]